MNPIYIYIYIFSTTVVGDGQIIENGIYWIDVAVGNIYYIETEDRRGVTGRQRGVCRVFQEDGAGWI